MSWPRVVGVLAALLGLVPLAWLAVRRSRPHVDWWLAAAFGVSFVADVAAFVGTPWQAVSLAYPVSQAALVSCVLRDREEVTAVLVVLLVVGAGAVWGLPRPDVLLRTVAWGLILRMAWPLPGGALRASLLVTFGLGLLAWYGFVAWPGWPTWLAYQSTRVAGTGLFCRAVA